MDTLRRVHHDRAAFASDLSEDLAAMRVLSGHAQRFYHELVYGVLRRRLTLDCVISAYCREPIATLEEDCLIAMRLGAYQMIFLNGVPPFAAIAESVKLVAHRHPGVRGLVNAVLRSIDTEMNKVPIDHDRGGASPRKRLQISDEHVVFFTRSVFVDPEQNLALHLAQVHSHPPFLVERWLRIHDRAVVEDMLVAGNRRPQVAARVNRLRTDREGLQRRLAAEHLVSRPGVSEDALLLDATPAEAVATTAFREGLFYLQDEAAMKVAAALAPRPGERILDLCAAPGGKSTHIAELAGDRAEVIAADRDAERLAKVEENCARLGIHSVKTVVFNPLSDPPGDAVSGPFDAILLDVPCSNTGVFARRPEARWRVSLESARVLADRGKALLDAMVRMVRPGGRIVYSTCSLEPEENAENVARALVSNPGLTLVRQEETLPSKHGPDGGYFAVLRVGVS